MATRSIIPVARLNSRVRKRLIDILSGREFPNASLIHSSSPGFECQQHLGQFNLGEGGSLTSRPTKFDGSKRCKIESTSQVKAKSFQETLQLSVEGKRLMEVDKDEKAGSSSGTEALCKLKSNTGEKKEKPKSQKARSFRAFMRNVACSQEGLPRGETRSDNDNDLASREKHSRKKARLNSSKKNGKHAKKTHEKSLLGEEKHSSDEKDFAQTSGAMKQNCLRGDAGEGLIEVDKDKKKGSGSDTLRVYPGNFVEKVDISGESGSEHLVTDSSGRYKTKGTHMRVEINSASKETSAEVRESQDDLTRNAEDDIVMKNDNSRNKNVLQNDDSLSETMTKECTIKNAGDQIVVQPEKVDNSYCLDVLFDPESHVESGVFYKAGSKVAQKKRDKRRRRGKKGNELKLMEGVSEEDKEKGATIDDGHKKKQKRLPNYFLALKVDSTTIADNVKRFQESVIDKEPAFKNVMIAVPTLHLTLMVMRLDNDMDIDNAKQALQSLKDKSGDLFTKWSKYISFTGIDTFRNKVIFIGIDHEKQKESISVIQEIVRCAHECFSTSGVELTEDKSKGEFTPHVTVMKMSKNVYKMKKKGIKIVDEKYYEDFVGFEFGQQQFSNILLCSMLDKKDENGFYQVIDSIDLNGKHD